jgi:hypothetical protein
MAPFTDQQIRDKYVADIRAATKAHDDAAIADGDVVSWFGSFVNEMEPVWTAENYCYWLWPDNIILSKRELEFFESSDTVWAFASVAINNNQLSIEIMLIDWYDPEAKQ